MSTTTDEDRHQQSRAHIAEVALGLLVDEGEDRLTMRAIATRLGVQASSLYTYVRDKDDLLLLIVERALGDPEECSADWETCTRDVIDRVAQIMGDGTACALRAAPALAAGILRARIAEAMRDAPFDEATRNDAANTLGTLLVGLVVWPGPQPQPTQQSVRPFDIRAGCELLLSGIALATQPSPPPAGRNRVVSAPQPLSSTGKWHRATR
jgi:AcrR family transcriptional regulator